ncbi:serine-rich adhesin for platelets-like [Gigantopelta aegis]|uniref:serine-rich adhesin for platelets-like n=1 Tax=Gigantopelta aegis TaxID=1735272 RepID=UPI001B887F0B|nr:serine-rich adhesin for platelets-like [Gigantopelta aegis]
MRERRNFSWSSPQAEGSVHCLESSTPSQENHRNHSDNNAMSTSKGEYGTLAALCAVCGEEANGNFFGALVCLPCKSFFIRCNKANELTSVQRPCDNRCTATRQGRVRCQRCRYLKCVQVGMVRREKPESVQPADGEILCLVCGDIANGIHFGIKTCEGCKKFFRRGLLENKTYVCTKQQACIINPRNRNNCRLCRYRKCVSSGMSRSAIKMGRPRKNRRNDTAMKKSSTRRRHSTKTPIRNEIPDTETKQQASNDGPHPSEQDFLDESMDTPLTLKALLMRTSHLQTKKRNHREKTALGRTAPLGTPATKSAVTQTSVDYTSCFKSVSLSTREDSPKKSPFDGFETQTNTQQGRYEDFASLASISVSVSAMQSSQLSLTTSVSQVQSSLLPVIKIHTPPSPLSPSLSPELESPSCSSSLSLGSSSLSTGSLSPRSLSPGSSSLSYGSRSLSPRSMSPGSRSLPSGPRSMSPGSLSFGSLSLSSGSSPLSTGSRSVSPGSTPGSFMLSSSSTSVSSLSPLQSSGPPSPLPVSLSHGSDPDTPEASLTSTEIEHMLMLLTSDDVNENGDMHELQSVDSNVTTVGDYAMETSFAGYVDMATRVKTRGPASVSRNSNMNLLQMALNVSYGERENVDPLESKEYIDQNNNTNAQNLGEVANVNKVTVGKVDSLSNQMMYSYQDSRGDEMNKSNVMHVDGSVLVKIENDSTTFPNHVTFSEKGPYFDICNSHASSYAKPDVKTRPLKDETNTCCNITNTCTFDYIISTIENFETCTVASSEDTYIPNCYPVKHVAPDNRREEKNGNLFHNQRQYQTNHGQHGVPMPQIHTNKEYVSTIVQNLDLIRDAGETYTMDIS